MTPHVLTAPSDPLDLLTAHADLPGAARILDPAQLTALLGRSVELSRVRIKPGASVMVGHRSPGSRPGGDAPADVGWAMLTADADKRDGALRRAARRDVPLQVREESGTTLLTGGLDADPRLGRSVDRALRRARRAGAQRIRVLSYNPAKHVVLGVPASEQVLRIASRPLDRLLRVAEAWRALELPTLALRPTSDAHAVRSAHWGQGDLADPALGPTGEGAAAAARTTGAAIARLHAAAPSAALPAARLGRTVPDSLDLLGELLPHRGRAVRTLAARLDEALPDAPRTGLLHGDLTPDQVLVDTHAEGTAAEPAIRIVDLDRSGTGPLGADLGAWLASCLVMGRPRLAEAFLEGYLAAGGALPETSELAAWTARALAAASVDPMRRAQEGWPLLLEKRLDLAGAVLGEPAWLPLPAGAAVPAPAARPASGTASTAQIPAQVRDGEVTWRVERAWPDDGRGLPLELRGDRGTLRGARVDPATGALTLHRLGEDPRLPGLARTLTAHPDGQLVSLRPGKRAVVRLAAGPGQRPARYVKIVRPGRAARLCDALATAAPFDGPFRTPALLAADEDTIILAELPGRTLHEPLRREDGTWQRAWRGVMDAWSQAITRSREEQSVLGDLHGPDAEAQVLITWLERARAVDPDGAAGREAAVGAALRALAGTPAPARPALVHRDLHDKQILHLEGAAPGLLDVDTATWGDPALDLGNLRAHTRWRELQEIWSADHAREVQGEIDGAADREGIDPDTLAAYEAATLARLTCVYAFRPRWQENVRRLAAEPAQSASAGTAPSAALASTPPHPAVPITEGP